MPATNTKLTTAVEQYFTDLRNIRASGGATPELSYYPPLVSLLNAVGATLKPKVFCVSQMAQQGAGHPDFGLYSARQIQKGKPVQGQLPEHGAIEVKPSTNDAWLTADGGQVSKYWCLYRLVLVTNTRDFVLLGEEAAGQPATSVIPDHPPVIPDSDRGPTRGFGTGNAQPVKLETFRLADSAEDFDQLLQKPRAFARDVGAGLGEYLSRALSTPPRSPSRGTSPGSSHPTPATASHVSRPTAKHRR